MSELFVMRRANGDLFAEQIGEKLRIPVWSSRDAIARYKARNPDLMIFLPVRLDRTLMKSISAMGENRATEFFLLSDSAPDAYLDDGRPITLEEIFPEGQIHSRPAAAQA